MLIPEIQIYKIISSILSEIKTDFKENSEKNTILYNMFECNTFGSFDYYTQAKAIFLKDNSQQRELQTRLFFDRSRAHFPTIHITLSNERDRAKFLGNNRGDAGYVVDSEDESYQNPLLNKLVDVNYNIIVTSDNAIEVSIIYHALNAMLFSLSESLEFAGLQNASISGGDLSIPETDLPQQIYSRGIMITAFYELEVKTLFSEKVINKMLIEAKLISPFIEERTEL